MFMQEIMIFDGISDAELSRMIFCFNAVRKFFEAGDTIMAYSEDFRKIGVMLSGSAELERYDREGNRTILERLSVNSVFGEIFSRPAVDDAISVICSGSGEVLFIDYEHLIKRCPNACTHHSVLVSNMLKIVSQKARHLSSRIEVLSQRTMRGKLLTYFEQLAKQEGKKSVTIPFALYTLADYLCVDRSAMLREMKKMRMEGVIDSQGRRVTLLK